ncbi:hypothetical protein DXC92_02535 [Clostridiales bacterium TF09-2AC]|nr:hypothetical protein DXC92_02535 [Clostridiales bacterium TF09-2AC]
MGNRKNMKKLTGILCAGVLMLSLSGCGSAYANEAGRQSEVTTAGGDMLKTSVNAKETGKPQPDAAFVEQAKAALENYFGVHMTDTTGYSVSVQYMDAMPEYEAEQQTAVTFLPEELNFGEITADTVIDMEHIDTKPMYDVSFNAEGEVKGIHLSYVDWVKSEMPVTAQSAEETAKQFVVSHQLAAEDSLKVLGSAAASSDTITVVIRHKEGRALLIGVDSLAGKVRYFEDMTEKSAVKSITPFEEGKGLG